MALTELQMPTKNDFYRNIQLAATEMDRLMTRWKDLSEFVGRMDSSDLDALGIATGQVRTDLNNFKALIDEMIELYAGNSVTPAEIPSSVIDAIRMM